MRANVDSAHHVSVNLTLIGRTRHAIVSQIDPVVVTAQEEARGPGKLAHLVERGTRGRKVVISNPGRSGGGMFSPESTSRADSYPVSVTTPCYRSGT